MPLAVSATTLSGATAVGSMNDTTWSAKSSSRSRSVRRPAAADRCGAPPSSTAAAMSLIVGQAGVRADRAGARPGRA